MFPGKGWLSEVGGPQTWAIRQFMMKLNSNTRRQEETMFARFMFARLMKAMKDEKGQGLAEYALILFLIAIVVIGALTTLGTNINTVLTNIGNALT